MSERNVRRVRQPGRQDLQLWGLMGAVGMALVACWVVSLSVKLGFIVTGEGTPAAQVPWNPAGVVIGMVSGELVWSVASVVVLVAIWVVLVIGVIAVLVWLQQRRSTRTRIDAAAEQLASGKDIASLSRQAAPKAGEQWCAREVVDEHPGLRLGHIPGSVKRGLFSTWEDLLLVLMGPRMGKSTAVVIPAMVDAPGVVVTTSNKRDVVDETLALTQSRGPVFVFDPQRIAVGVEQEPWFFDPLEMICRDEAVMDAAAMELADIFKCAARGKNDSGDAFFSDGGRDLLARLFLAAALDSRPISDVFIWVNDEKDKTPVRILSQYPQWGGSSMMPWRVRMGLRRRRARGCFLRPRRWRHPWGVVKRFGG